jgi:hypothetical protein
MEFSKTLEIDATYQCGHTLHLTKTVHNDDEEECFVCWTYDCELCPDCKEQNKLRYREVYDTIENPSYDLYTILFKRRSGWTGSMVFEETLLNKSDCLRSTQFLVEHHINGGNFLPVGIYRRDHFVPFSGYTAEYMQFLLRHDREAVQAENDLRNATVDEQTLYTKVNPEAWGL